MLPSIAVPVLCSVREPSHINPSAVRGYFCAREVSLSCTSDETHPSKGDACAGRRFVLALEGVWSHLRAGARADSRLLLWSSGLAELPQPLRVSPWGSVSALHPAVGV